MDFKLLKISSLLLCFILVLSHYDSICTYYGHTMLVCRIVSLCVIHWCNSMYWPSQFFFHHRNLCNIERVSHPRGIEAAFISCIQHNIQQQEFTFFFSFCFVLFFLFIFKGRWRNCIVKHYRENVQKSELK